MSNPQNLSPSVVQAEPAERDCDICFEAVNFVRKLPCSHTLCSSCFELLEHGIGNVTCPSCRQKVPNAAEMTGNFLRFGRLRCDECSELKESEDSWFCEDCLTILCSRCVLKQHRNHETTEWTSLRPLFIARQILNSQKTGAKHPEATEQNTEIQTAAALEGLKRELTGFFGQVIEGILEDAQKKLHNAVLQNKEATTPSSNMGGNSSEVWLELEELFGLLPAPAQKDEEIATLAQREKCKTVLRKAFLLAGDKEKSKMIDSIFIDDDITSNPQMVFPRVEFAGIASDVLAKELGRFLEVSNEALPFRDESVVPEPPPVEPTQPSPVDAPLPPLPMPPGSPDLHQDAPFPRPPQTQMSTPTAQPSPVGPVRPSRPARPNPFSPPRPPPYPSASQSGPQPSFPQPTHDTLVGQKLQMPPPTPGQPPSPAMETSGTALAGFQSAENRDGQWNTRPGIAATQQPQPGPAQVPSAVQSPGRRGEGSGQLKSSSMRPVIEELSEKLQIPAPLDGKKTQEFGSVPYPENLPAHPQPAVMYPSLNVVGPEQLTWPPKTNANKAVLKAKKL